MEKICVITHEQLDGLKEIAKTVYNRDFKVRGISPDRIADADSCREEFVSKCYTELQIETLSDKLVTALINARKNGELKESE